MSASSYPDDFDDIQGPETPQQGGGPTDIDELTDVVSQTLEAKGILGQLKAQMRAAVYTAILDQEREEGELLMFSYFPSFSLPLMTYLILISLCYPGIYMENTRLMKITRSEEGALLAHLISEYLEFCELDFTHSVFQGALVLR